MTAGPLDHIVITPSSSTKASGDDETYTVEGFDAADNDLGDVTSETNFSIAGGTCNDNACHAASVGAHTVTADAGGGIQDTATLHVTAGPLDHIVITPSSSTKASGDDETYTVEGFDAADNDLGDVTSETNFSIAGGTCNDNACHAASVGAHTVTADAGGGIRTRPHSM